VRGLLWAAVCSRVCWQVSNTDSTRPLFLPCASAVKLPDLAFIARSAALPSSSAVIVTCHDPAPYDPLAHAHPTLKYALLCLPPQPAFPILFSPPCATGTMDIPGILNTHISSRVSTQLLLWQRVPWVRSGYLRLQPPPPKGVAGWHTTQLAPQCVG
jgi:hypothetical protein